MLLRSVQDGRFENFPGESQTCFSYFELDLGEFLSTLAIKPETFGMESNQLNAKLATRLYSIWSAGDHLSAFILKSSNNYVLDQPAR